MDSYLYPSAVTLHQVSSFPEMYFKPICSHQFGPQQQPHYQCQSNYCDRSPHTDRNVVTQPVSKGKGSPRSAAEEYVEDVPKFRQLPCRTFISVGTCPYRERCVYLHDPRLMSRDAKTKTRKKNKEDIVQDSLFWPVLAFQEVSQRLDSSRLPHVIQRYGVPAPREDQYRRHDQAVYSMWMHFVTFCSLEVIVNPFENEADMATYLHPGFHQNPWQDKSEIESSRPRGLFLDESVTVNPFINMPRLSIFKHLSQGEPGTACTPRSTTPSIPSSVRSSTPPGSNIRLGIAPQRTVTPVPTGHSHQSTSPHSMIGYPNHPHGPAHPNTRQPNLAARLFEFERDREQAQSSIERERHTSQYERDFNHRTLLDSRQIEGDDPSTRYHTVFPTKCKVQQTLHSVTHQRAREISLRSFSCFGPNGLYSVSPTSVPSQLSEGCTTLRTRSRMDSVDSFCGDIGTPTSVSESFSPILANGDHGLMGFNARNLPRAPERSRPHAVGQREVVKDVDIESERQQVRQFNEMIRLRDIPSTFPALHHNLRVTTSSDSGSVSAISPLYRSCSSDDDHSELSYLDDEIQRHRSFSRGDKFKSTNNYQQSAHDTWI